MELEEFAKTIFNTMRPQMGSFQHQLMDEFKEIFLSELSRKPNWRREEIEDAFDNAVTKFINEKILGYTPAPEESFIEILERVMNQPANIGPTMASFGDEYLGPERREKKVMPPPAGMDR